MNLRPHRRPRYGITILWLAILGVVASLGPLACAPVAEACPIPGAHAFIRGEVNADGVVDVSDPIHILAHLFLSPLDAPISCDDAADANDDEAITLADVFFLLDHLFAGTATLPAPFPDCGPDPTSPDLLPCISHASCQGFESGTLAVDWIHGSPNCSQNMDPPIQVHQFNEDTFILRQNKCVNFEGPFMYLLFGEDTVFLQDTGATSNPTQLPIQETVQGIIDQWLDDHGQASIELVVTHSHSHGDHVQGDVQFIGQPNTTVVGTSLAAVTGFFGIDDWPDEIVCYDLGGRVLDIIPIPGHESRHIAVYDRDSGILLTGDSLYPGFLFVSGQSNWNAYKQSIERLVAFASTRTVHHVLGTHIEMSDEPGIPYPYGSTYQPNEHALELDVSHLVELDEALQLLPTPAMETHDDFIITGF